MTGAGSSSNPYAGARFTDDCDSSVVVSAPLVFPTGGGEEAACTILGGRYDSETVQAYQYMPIL